MVKKIGIILSFVVAAQCAYLPGIAFAQQTTCPPECVTDTLEMVTWYPSPYSEYEELRLYPKVSAEESQCDSFEELGLMYYNKDEQALKLCRFDSNVGYRWELVSYWKLDSGGNISNTNSSGKVVVGALQLSSGAQAGKVLTSDASGNATWQDPSASGGGRKSYTIAGAYQFYVPSGVDTVFVTLIGGGGGGQGGGGYCGNYGNGGGGGGAATGYDNYLVSVIAESYYTITVGAGGSGGLAYNNSGGGGGASSFGGLLSASGGGGGSGRGGCNSGFGGGMASTGDNGASSKYGVGGDGGGLDKAGKNAVSFGAGGGGGGGAGNSSNSSNIGGNGRSGLVIVEW